MVGACHWSDSLVPHRQIYPRVTRGLTLRDARVWVGSSGHRDSVSVDVVGGGPVEGGSGDGVDPLFDVS